MIYYFNEEEMRKICERYGIEVIEEGGAPTLNGEEITEEMLHQIMTESVMELREELIGLEL